jgi:hypothetical protein
MGDKRTLTAWLVLSKKKPAGRRIFLHDGGSALGRLPIRGLGLASTLVPAPAQCLVKSNLGTQLRQAIGNQRLLGAEQRSLGIQEGQVAVDANAIPTLRQAIVILVGRDEIALSLQLIVIGLARGQAIGVWMVFSYVATLMSFCSRA